MIMFPDEPVDAKTPHPLMRELDERGRRPGESVVAMLRRVLDERDTRKPREARRVRWGPWAAAATGGVGFVWLLVFGLWSMSESAGRGMAPPSDAATAATAWCASMAAAIALLVWGVHEAAREVRTWTR